VLVQELEDSNNRNSLDVEQHSQCNTRMCHWSIEALLVVVLSQNVDAYKTVMKLCFTLVEITRV